MFFKQKQLGAVRDKKDYRDLYYEMIAGGEWEDIIGQLPKSFKLNYDKHWRYNQGKTSACGSHGACGILNFKYQTKTSPRYLWKFVKRISNLAWGSYTRDNVQGLVQFGSCTYDLAPNTNDNIKSDANYQDFAVNGSMQQEASKMRCTGYVRANGLIGNNYDSIRKFIYETKSPVILSFPYYSSFNGTPDGGIFIRKANDKSFVGHIVLCKGWNEKGLILVDSFDRTVTYPKEYMVWDAWGVLDFKAEKIKLPKKPANRNLKTEQTNALVLKTMIYKEFASTDKARITAFKHWFRLVNAVSYKGYTFTDLMNWIYFLDRKGKELFDIEDDRANQIK